MDLTFWISLISAVLALVAIILVALVLKGQGRDREQLRVLARRPAPSPRRATARTGDGTTGGADDAEEPDAEEDRSANRLRRVAVVVNPSKFKDIDVFQDRVREAVERIEGADVRFYETTIDDPGRGQAEQAVADGADLVMAAGGDGTVRLVASVLAGSDTRMGIIPAGTGNLLARNVGIPLEDPSAAMIAALTGEDHAVDVGWLRVGDSPSAAFSAERKIFLVIAGFGADAEMIGNTDEGMKKRIGWIAYIFGGLRALVGRSTDVVVELPDETRHAHKARTVLLGNVGKLPGGLVLMPDATIDNGRLEVVVAGWRGAAGFSQVATQVLNPNYRPPRFGPRISTMERYLTAGVRVTTAKPQMVQLDGDTDREATHIVATVDPGALRLRVPQDSDLSQDAADGTEA